MRLGLAVAIAVIGFIFTSKQWLQFINSLSPEAGLVLKNVIIFLIILGLHSVDDVVDSPHRQALGVLLMYSAFNIIFNYQSEWIHDAKAPNVDKQTPDGALYERARSLFSPDMSRIIVFVLVPFIFVIIGSSLISKRVKLN